jgi:hypothetical protein
MTPQEADILRTTSLRKQGKSFPYAHPHKYLDAGSILTVGGIDWAVPPLFPASATAIVPTFGEDGEVSVSADVDETVVDEDLAALAQKIRELVKIEELDACPTCGVPQGGQVVIDTIAESEAFAALFKYARMCLLKLYDLTAENLRDLLAFTSDALPQWVTQVLDHKAQQRGD